MTPLAGCTAVSANYLAYARTLARSFRQQHPDGRFFVLLVDRLEERFDPAEEPFILVQLEDLDTIPDPHGFLFKYNCLEVITALKPYFMTHLFERHGVERLLWLDPDILITAPLAPVEAALDRASIVLTPHLTAPLDDPYFPDERAFLRAGTFNLGFLGLSASDMTSRFLAWWRQRLFDLCVVRVEEGLFVDQKWIDLVPGLFEGVAILRDPGLNTAYWNLAHRDVRHAGERWTVNGQPLLFFHFSGIDATDLDPLSRHQDRFTLDDLPELRPLFEHYRDLLSTNGFEEARSWRYAFDYFDDGLRIHDVARSLYRSLGEARQRFGNPFAGRRGSFRQWMNGPAKARPYLSRFLRHLHDLDRRLVRRFPDPAGADLKRFARWLDLNGRLDLGLDDELLAPVAPLFASAFAPLRPRHRLAVAKRRAYDMPAVKRLRKAVKYWVGAERADRLRGLASRMVRGYGNRGDRPGVSGARQLPTAAGVNLFGYLKTESGMGEATRSLVRSLEAAAIPFCLTDIDFNGVSRRNDTTLSRDSEDPRYNVNLLVANADQVPLVARHLGATRFLSGYNIGLWLWEQEEFPQRWYDSFAYLDEVWTPSRFGLDLLSAVSLVPVRRVPLSIAPRAPVNVDRGRWGLDDGEMVFLFAFDFLSYFERKNPLGLIEAFRKAFRPDEPVRLMLKTINAERDPQNRERLVQAARGARVEFVDRYVSRQELDQLVAACDCYVSLHRSEGFGLTVAEAMVLGKPVVVTDYSGTTDFVDMGSGMPVPYRMVTLEEDHGPYPAGSRWAEPDLDRAAESMRRLYEEPELRERLGSNARERISQRFSPSAVGEIVRSRLEAALRRSARNNCDAPHPRRN